jgi:hypothetical protein
MEPLAIILGILVTGALVYLIVLVIMAARRKERIRLAELAGWARTNHFEFHATDCFNLDRRFRGIAEIGRGHDRYAFEVLHRTAPIGTFLFRYHFETTETRTVTDAKGNTRTETYEQDHWRTYLIVELGAEFPQFLIRREGFMDRIAGFVGFDDIDFESSEFSRRYFCKSADRRFAYALIHPQMIDWMLPLEFELEINRGLLVRALRAHTLSATTCQEAIGLLAGFINRIPEFVWSDWGRISPVKLPSPEVYELSPAEMESAARGGM